MFKKKKMIIKYHVLKTNKASVWIDKNNEAK